jgi:putative tryptophan/tyrosine transport system substrate-binding protein
MRRRDFISLLGGTALAPLCANAQHTERIARIGYLSFSSASEHASRIDAFRAGLRKLGYVEGKNVQIEFRFADGDNERLPGLAAELVDLNVDVILTFATGVPVAKHATATIPIVMATYGDAVAAGIIASLSHPGGNVTGLTFFSPELTAKRLELLKEVASSMTRAGVFLFPGSITNSSVLEAIGVTARTLGVGLQLVEVGRLADLESAFSALADQQIDALVLGDHAFFIVNADVIAALAAKHRFLSIGPLELARDGGLMAYGVNFPDQFRRAAVFVDKILKGTKPGDIPVEQATKFEFVINLKTAKLLGLTMPPTLLVRADEVIE